MLSALKGGKLSTVLLVPVIVGLILTGMPTAAKAAGPLPIKTPADARAWGFDSLGNMMSGKMASYPKPHGAHLLLNPRYKVPLPTNLAQFVKNRQAALVLGKALFWDMQWAPTASRPAPPVTFRPAVMSAPRIRSPRQEIRSNTSVRAP